MKSESPRLRRIEVPLKLLELLRSGDVRLAAAAAITRILQTSRDQVLPDAALTRSGLGDRTALSRATASLRKSGAQLLCPVHQRQQRGYAYRIQPFAQVLDAFELPPVERLLLMAMQVEGKVLSAKVWAARVFFDGSHAAQCVDGALRRLTALGLAENPQGWAWRAMPGLQATEPEAEPIDVCEEVGEADRLVPLTLVEMDEMAAKLNPLLSQAIQASQPAAEPVPVVQGGRLSECLAAHRSHLAAGGPLPPDLADEPLARILVGAAIDLIASSRAQRISRLEPDIFAGALQVVAWERRLLVAGEGRTRDNYGHWVPLVQAGAMRNFPQAMLTALYAAFGQSNSWRKFLSLRELFTPGLDGGWDQLAVTALSEARGKQSREVAMTTNRGKEMPVPQRFEDAWLPKDIHRLHCDRARIQRHEMGLRISAEGYNDDLDKAYAIADGRDLPQPATTAPTTVAAAPHDVQPSAAVPPKPNRGDAFVQRELSAAKSAFYQTWQGPAGPKALLALLSATARPVSVEHEVCLYLRRLRQGWATLQRNHGKLLTDCEAWGEMSSFDALWATLAPSAPTNPEVESLFGMPAAEVGFADLLAVRLPEDGGEGPLVDWGQLVERRDSTREDVARLRETRVAAWLTRPAKGQEAACG